MNPVCNNTILLSNICPLVKLVTKWLRGNQRLLIRFGACFMEDNFTPGIPELFQNLFLRMS